MAGSADFAAQQFSMISWELFLRREKGTPDPHQPLTSSPLYSALPRENRRPSSAELDDLGVALSARTGINAAAVALANKNARIIWALLTKRECYQPSSGL